MCSLALEAPVTPGDDGYPLHVRITEGNDIYGFVQCGALCAMDLGVREREGSARVVGSLDDDTMSRVLACVRIVTGLDRE